MVVQLLAPNVSQVIASQLFENLAISLLADDV
jgi:hypothetical protein